MIFLKKSKVVKWGNSTGIRIPLEALLLLDLNNKTAPGTEANIYIENDDIIIKIKKDSRREEINEKDNIKK